MTDAKQFLEQHKADLVGGPGVVKFELTDDMKAIVDLIVEERRAGKRYSMLALHRVIKKEFEIQISYEQFRRVVREHAGGRW